ncbi:unnamed protein product, partial [Ceratitis capitata]
MPLAATSSTRKIAETRFRQPAFCFTRCAPLASLTFALPLNQPHVALYAQSVNYIRRNFIAQLANGARRMAYGAETH